MSDKTFHLERFVEAQSDVYQNVCAELRAGRKETHWMWFIFPQIRGLGSSGMAEHFAIVSLDEANAYLAHPLLGPRLAECTQLVIATEGRSVESIFGWPDDMKFRSSMTLFAACRGAKAPFQQAPFQQAPFQQALDKFFGGEPDRRTLELLDAVP
jgi:uncharacterized protein (DUF1810 family)